MTYGYRDEQESREAMRELQRMVHRVCALILSSKYSILDLMIERQSVRNRCEELFPDNMELYDMVYESRFNRLMEQFRQSDDQQFDF